MWNLLKLYLVSTKFVETNLVSTQFVETKLVSTKFVDISYLSVATQRAPAAPASDDDDVSLLLSPNRLKKFKGLIQEDECQE
jgi:hypothetical protein